MKNVIKLKRQLTPREVRRLKVHQLLPANAANMKLYENEFKKRSIGIYAYDDFETRKSRASMRDCLKGFKSAEYKKGDSEQIDNILLGYDKSILAKFQSGLKYPELVPIECPTKALIICEKMDQAFKAIIANCKKLDIKYYVVRHFEPALEIFDSNVIGDYQLLIVDARKKYNDALLFGQTFRMLRNSEYTVLVAIVEQKLSEKMIPIIIPLLEVGYNRCVRGNPDFIFWNSELRQICHSLVKPQCNLSLQKVLYQSMNTSDAAMLITDHNLRIQYANKSFEEIIDKKMEEILGITFQSIAKSDLIGLEVRTRNLKKFQGSILLNNQEVQVNAMPVSYNRCSISHVIMHFTIPRKTSSSGIKFVSFKDGSLVKGSKISAFSDKYGYDQEDPFREKIGKLLIAAMEWDFDIFELERLTNNHPMLHLGMEIFKRFNVFKTLQIDEETCANWFMLIEANYEADNKYHNSTHGADVMQASSYFLQKLVGKGSQVFDDLNEACVLIASAVHDVGHPGKSSPYLVNSDSPLAILYNDVTVLESHHAALTFKLTLTEPACNIFRNLERHVYRDIRPKIIDMILATDMSKHFEHLAKFIGIFGDFRNMEKTSDEELGFVLRRMMVKCADVSSPMRTMRFTMEWAIRITIEYLEQTEEEKSQNLPVVMPMFDRDSYSVPRCQVGFFEFIILKMMEAWDDFLNIPDLMKNMKSNYEDWKKFDFQGLHSLEDIQQKLVYLSHEGRSSE